MLPWIRIENSTSKKILLQSWSDLRRSMHVQAAQVHGMRIGGGMRLYALQERVLPSPTSNVQMLQHGEEDP